MKKCEICYLLLKKGQHFITEAEEIKTGLRRDIVCLDDGIIYEIELSHIRAMRHKDHPKVEVIRI